MHERILTTLSDPLMLGKTSELSDRHDIFKLLNFSAAHSVMSEQPCAYVLALTHAVWQHASIGQLSLVPRFVHFGAKVAPSNRVLP